MNRFITDKYQVAEFENLAKDKILLRTRLVAASGNTSTSDPDYDSYYFTVDYFPFDITKPLFFENFYISKIKKDGAYGEAGSSVI
jgi:hypothetical protein